MSKKSQKSAPVLPLIKKTGLFWGVRARKCGGVKGSPRHHFEAQKTRRKMVPKLLTKTPASSRSAYPKMAIFAQIHFPAQPRIWPIWPSGAKIGVNRARPQRCGGVKGSPSHHFSCHDATRKMVARTFIRTPASSSSGQKKAQKMAKKIEKFWVPKIMFRSFF